MNKKQDFLNSGLYWPFSEKRYICFPINILAALLIIFIPNLVRKCQIICSKICAEETVFLRFFGIVCKENRLFLLPWQPSSRRFFLDSNQSILYPDIFYQEVWNMRYCFYCLHFHGNKAQNLNMYQHFLWFCKFQFYIYILTNIQGCVVLFAQNILF